MKQVKAQERLDKILANHGIGTRSEVKKLLKSGSVMLNGNIVKNGDLHVNLTDDQVEVNGEILKIKTHAYFMMNKKAGYVCTSKTGANPIVLDLVDDIDRSKKLGGELGIVGRLDIDTEGLLILTTDGELNHQLTSPKYNIPKKYLVKLRDKVDAAAQKKYSDRIKKGVEIPPEDHEPAAKCRGGEVEWLDEESCWLTIYEGLYHEVKRIFAALGNQVVYLKRISLNHLELDKTLEPGEYRELSSDELLILRHTLTNGNL